MAMNVADVELLVTPEQLTIASAEMSDSLNRMQINVDELDQIVRATENYWKGEAGDMYRDLFLKERENINLSITRLQEHPRDLIEIAGNYIDTEQILQSLAEELPADVIS